MIGSPGRRLRELLEQPGLLRTFGAHDVFTALLLEEAGAQLLFLGGFGASASLSGYPDLNLLGVDEMAAATRRMAHRLRIPLIADGDTGHGGLANVVRTVEELEGAGAGGMILEDQEFPKRCGHFEGKRVIPAEEMLRKWEAALRARRDPDFVFVARSDARDTHGIEEAIRRVNLYCDAGADIAFVESPASRAELELVAERVRHPTLVNLLTFGRTPLLPAAELARLGFKIAVAPIETLLVLAPAIRKLARAFLDTGSVDGIRDELATFDDVKRVLGLEKLLGAGGSDSSVKRTAR